MKTTHHAEYLMPGTFFPEETTRELDQRSTEEAIAKAPARAFCFVLYDLPEIDLEYDETLVSVTPKRQNVSGRYYIDGEVFTVDDLKAMNHAGELDILISNAEGNDWPLMVRTRVGNWQPFEDNDTVVKTVRPEVTRG